MAEDRVVKLLEEMNADLDRHYDELRGWRKVMTEDNRADLMLEHLRAIRKDVADVKTDVRSLQTQMIAVQGQMGSVQTQLASVAGDVIEVKDRVERIEQRLELAEA